MTYMLKTQINDAISTMTKIKREYEEKAAPRRQFKRLRHNYALAIAALEKQLPKKPTAQSTDEKTHYKCACCDTILLTVYKDGIRRGCIHIYCSKCGQRQESEV